MKLNIKNIFLFVGVFVFTFGLLVSNAYAAAPTITGAVYLDTNGNGTVDRVDVTFSEPVEVGSTFEASDWTFPTNPHTLVVNSGVIVGTDVRITVTGAPAMDTLLTATEIKYTNQGTADSIKNAGAEAAATSANTAVADRAAPLIKTFDYLDQDVDGKIDAVIATFTENVTADSVLSANDLVFTNVGDFTGVAFGSLATDLISGSVANVTIPLGTEATVLDTGDTSGTLAISSQNLFSLTDGTNTNSTLGALTATFVDTAKPQIKSFTYSDVDADGKVDRVTLTYTEALNNGSFLAAKDLVFTNVGGLTGAAFGANATDLITVTGTTSTDIDLGTEGSVVATVATGAIAISSQDAFSLLDTNGNNNTTIGAEDQAIFIDNIDPLVLTVSPINGATNVARNSNIVITFSEPMNTSSLSFSTSPSRVTTPVWTVGNTVATLSHSTSLTGSTVYTATVAVGTTDVSLNGLTVPKVWSFTTIPGSSGGGSTSSKTTSSTTTSTTTTETENKTETTPKDDFAGCTAKASFSVTTGKSCAGYTAPDATDYAGCDGRNTGFSVTTGKSCAGNVVKTTTTTTTVTTTTTSSYAFGTSVIKEGVKGEACRAWQAFFNAKAGSALAVDGICGPMTMSVAKAWQKAMGLTVDGLLGPASRAKALSQ